MAGARVRTAATLLIIFVLAAAVGVAAFVGGRHGRGPNRAAPGPTATATTTATTTASVPPAPSVAGGAIRSPARPAPPPSAAVPRAAAVAGAFLPLVRAGALGGSVHALVVDARSGSRLASRAAGVAVPPASTNKLATASALLAAVGADQRITTRVVAGAKAGQIVLVGAGDPTLSAASAGRPTIYPGAARMSELAAQIKARSHRRITRIVVDSSLFTGPLVAPGWDPSDAPSTYASPVTATVVDGGRPADGGELRSGQPDLDAGRALAERLGVPRATVVRGRAPRGASALAAVRSPTVLDLVEQMLSESDNVLAEMLARQVARATHQPLSFAGAVVAIRRVLTGLGVAWPRTLVDASGLSSQDRIAPSVLVALLRIAVSGPAPDLRQVVPAMPVAGWEGTLATRYRVRASAAGAGRVRAKTGTLTGVVTLAGLVRDRSGRLLVFAVMADQVPADGTLAAEAALDVAVSRLARCGCR